MEIPRLKGRLRLKSKKIPALPLFVRTIAELGLEFNRHRVDTIQVNMGRLCNQSCTHCYMEASSTRRKQNMGPGVVNRLLEILQSSRQVRKIDITGGAPELNPYFKELVTCARKIGIEVVIRSGLTLLVDPEQDDLIDFLKKQHVHIIGSFPSMDVSEFEKQRGKGTFLKAIEALKALNFATYGRIDSPLRLDLVMNATGFELPGAQFVLESQFKKQLMELYKVTFHRLFVMNNMPIKRWAKELERKGKFGEYMSSLAQNFNPKVVDSVMCRHVVAVGWEGRLFDCDFNQSLEIPLGRKRRTIWDIESFDELVDFPIALANHCYGCTAGAGSSFCGSLV